MDIRKSQVLEVESGVKIEYRIPAVQVIFDCFFMVLGKDFDLAEFDPADLTATDQMRLVDAIFRQAVVSWQGFIDQDGTPLDFDIALIDAIPLQYKTLVFRSVMDFFVKTLAVAGSTAGLAEEQAAQSGATIVGDSIVPEKRGRKKMKAMKT